MPRSFWWFACDALAVYRLARLVSVDAITAPWRELVRAQAFSTEGIQISSAWAWTFELVSCVWCMSVWFAAGVVALTKLVPGVWQYGAMGLALSAVAGYLAER